MMILHIMTNPLYLLACLGVGFSGRKRRIGFLGFAALAWLTTPIIGAIVLYVSAPRPPREPKLEGPR